MSDGSKKFYFLLQNHMALYKGANKVAGSAGAGFSPENAGTEGQFLKKTSTGYAYDDVDALPSGGTEGQVLTKTSSGADRADPAAAGIILDPNSPITIEKIWAGTEQQYSELSSYDNNTAYLTI